MGQTRSGWLGSQVVGLAAKIGLILILQGLWAPSSAIASSGVASSEMESNDRYCFYKRDSYHGQRHCGSRNTSGLGLGWFHKTSSLRVKEGYELVAFSRIGYWGQERIFSGENPKLEDWDNRIASFYTRRTQAEQHKACFYTRKNYQGRRFCTTENRPGFSWFWNDRISSVSIPSGLKVTLYSRWLYRGNSKTLLSSTPDLGKFNNLTTSLKIETHTQSVDSDGDGVDDTADSCAETPLGEMINKQGCSPSQLDADADGVTDDIDQCPNTPAGNQVDKNGCAPDQLDTDNDGVSNDQDQCPATPTDEIADAQGCGPSQRDEDNDSVSDKADHCPATPPGETVNAAGCSATQLDADADGVNNAVDQCAATPAGEAVNDAGCSLTQLDTDEDGVNDALDHCPATPADLPVNAAGCATVQLDSDSDGINDALDQCPATPAGAAPNAVGCSPDQMDTDNDGTPDYLDAFPNDPNETADLDGDGIGDNADPDRDGDGVDNNVDVFPNDASESADLDGDGIGDNADTDRDADGVENGSDAFPNDPSETADLDGDGIGDNADTDRDGDGVDNDQDLFPSDPTEHADLDGDGIGDNSDPDIDGDGVNNEDDYFPTDPAASSVPTVQITSPATLITVGSSPIQLTGTVDDLDASIIINGVQILQNSGTFQADVALEEGANNIIVRAIDSQNHEGTATIAVSLDKTPPYITLQSPENGSTVYTDAISVSGLVNDIVRGTVSEDDADVVVASQINTVTASVSNRSYLAESVNLQEGDNTLTISATDAVGNTNSETITVTYAPQTDKVIELVSGQAQTAVIQTPVTEPLVVQLTENGAAVVDKTVIFRVTEGDGLLQPGSSAEGNGAVVKTDVNGQAQVTYKLGSRAGTGNHKVTVRAVGFEGEVLFYHSADYSDGIQMGIIAGNNQRGSIRQPLPQPLTLAVTDQGANLIPNANIEFEVTKGTGKFNNGETTYTTTTDTDGRASAMFTLGAEQGLDVQRVTARLVGTPATAGFTVSGFMPGDPGQTAISGVVLDNQDQPMPNVTIRIEGSSRQAITDSQGQFTITETPVGPVHLLIEGSTTTRAGEWPSLSYNIVTVPGVDNPMASPIYLVEIDTQNAVYVGAEDKIVTHPELPGFELEVKAGSVTFPDGAKEGKLSITRVNANKIPMPPPNGMQPQLIVTIQPHGAMFDPPARLTLPNTDAHAPLAEIEMYSYDHDLEEFVTIGLGTVSKDGATVTSNNGVGVIKAGWHCGSAPVGSGCCINCAECRSLDQDLTGSCSCDFDGSLPLNEENQEPDDCKVLLCGGGSNPADETSEVQQEDPCLKCEAGSRVIDEEKQLPEDQQTPNDCKVNKCDGSVHPHDDPLEDQDLHDCKKPICDGADHDIEVDYGQAEEDEVLDACNKATHQCIVVDGTPNNLQEMEKHSGQPLEDTGNKCHECVDGDLVDYDGWLINPKITKQIATPSGPAGLAENLLKRVGVSVSTNWKGAVEVAVTGCCDPQSGEKGESWKGSIGMSASASANFQIWPCFGCPDPTINIDVGTALAYVAIGVQVQGGVYASGSLSVGGTVSHTESSCDGQTCTEAELGVSGSIGPVGRISGSVCYAQGGALLADLSACAALVGEVGGSASGKGSVSGSTCTGFNGGFCFEGLSASISISGEITYQGIKYSESISFTTPKVLGNCNG